MNTFAEKLDARLMQVVEAFMAGEHPLRPYHVKEIMQLIHDELKKRHAEFTNEEYIESFQREYECTPEDDPIEILRSMVIECGGSV